MKRLAVFALAAAISPSLRAGDVSLYYLYNALAEYEGTGYRTFDQGWELKVKPKRDAAALRWRHALSDGLALQVFYLGNRAFFDREDGNAASALLRQTGQTRLQIHSLMADLRRPLEGSSAGVLAGVHGAREVFERKDIVFNQVPETGQARETLSALGAYAGFYGGRRPGRGRGFVWDWEASIGHFFLTRNAVRTDGGSIGRDGYSYTFRAEAGYQKGNWGLAVGYFRQLLQIMVPGGKTFPGGAAASLPINKTDVFSPFVSLTYAY
jgi:hypothetical protein